MLSNMFFRKSFFIIISFLIMLSISVTAFSTEQATEPVDTSTEAVASAEANPTNENKDDDNNDNDVEEKAKDRKNDLKVALIGFAGGAVPAIISVIYQSISTNKTLKNSNDQFREQMTQQNKALNIQLEQVRNEQERYANAKKEEAIKMLMTEEYLECKNMEKRVEYYNQTLNAELKRIEAMSHPNSKRERVNNRWYNPINSLLCSMSFGCNLHSIVITNIGKLVNYIDGYNRLTESERTFDTLNRMEVLLNSIYSTVSEIEKDVDDLLKEDKERLSEYYKKSAESMFDIARQLEPQTNIDSKESKQTE